jgi:hypothetical protein
MVNPAVLSLGGTFAAAICAIGVENAWQQGSVLGGIAWGLGLVVSIALSTIPVWRNKLDQTKGAAQTCMMGSASWRARQSAEIPEVDFERSSI